MLTHTQIQSLRPGQTYRLRYSQQGGRKKTVIGTYSRLEQRGQLLFVQKIERHTGPLANLDNVVQTVWVWPGSVLEIEETQ